MSKLLPSNSLYALGWNEVMLEDNPEQSLGVFSKKENVCMQLCPTLFFQLKFTNSKRECGQEENIIYVQSCILPLLNCLINTSSFRTH